MWTLITETKHGLDNRTEALPLVIDGSYHVGFSWARQPGIRITKDFGDKIWLGFSIENAETTLTAHGENNNFIVGAFGASGGSLNPVANYAFSTAPDFVFKAAFEPGWGHYEIFGVVSTFRDRVFPNETAATPSAAGAYNDRRRRRRYRSERSRTALSQEARCGFALLRWRRYRTLRRIHSGGCNRPPRRHTRSHSQLPVTRHSRMAHHPQARCVRVRRRRVCRAHLLHKNGGHRTRRGIRSLGAAQLRLLYGAPSRLLYIHTHRRWWLDRIHPQDRLPTAQATRATSSKALSASGIASTRGRGARFSGDRSIRIWSATLGPAKAPPPGRALLPTESTTW